MSESSQSNDLRNRIVFTILILAVYRLGTFVPLPGIDPEQLQLMMEGKEVYFVDKQDKDPSEMGFENFTKLIQKTTPMTYSSLLEQKLSV